MDNDVAFGLEKKNLKEVSDFTVKRRMFLFF